MKLRILALNWRDAESPQAGGADYHLHEVLKRLVARGHSATLVASQFAGRRARTNDLVGGYEVLRVGSWWNAHMSIPRAARRLMTESKFDVVIDDVNKIPFFAPAWSARPVVAFFHHLLGRSAFVETNPAFAAAIVWQEKRIPRVYGSTPSLVVSRSTSEELLSMGLPGTHQRIVPPGIDHDLHGSGTLRAKGRLRLAVVSRLKRYKRVDLAIRSLQILREEHPHATLHVVGTGEERGRLELLSRRLDQPVTFHGQVSDPAKAKILQDADFLLNPSMKEGWGIAVIEAMASGAIPVVSDVGGHRDSAVEGAAVRISRPDPCDYARAISRLISDLDRMQSMRERGMVWSQRFRWDRVADAVEGMLWQAMSGATQGSTGVTQAPAAAAREGPA